MSEIPHDDGARDPRLAAIYRAADDDAPPPALDAAIRAAARREVGARPRPAGFSFVRSWRGALSVAAVLVLSASLVIVMREEAPEVMSPQGSGELGAPESKEKLPTIDKNSADADERAPYKLDAQPPKNLGLKPSDGTPSSGLSMRQRGFTEEIPKVSSDAPASRAARDPAAPAQLAKRRDSVADNDESRSNKTTMAEPKPQRPAEKPASRNEFAQAPAAPPGAEPAAKQAPPSAASAGNVTENRAASRLMAREAQSDVQTERAQKKDLPERPAADTLSAASAPAAAAPPPPVAAQSAKGKLERDAELTPDKWLARIEEMRKQGRLDEARASLLEFKKRYPDYRLPESLRDGIK